MADCGDSGLNSQLKTLQARLDRVDNDLLAHYAGISQLVAGLAANPLTAAAAATSLPIYNFSSMGQNLLKRLMGLIPQIEQFKQLQYLDAAALVTGMAGNFANIGARMTTSVTEAATTAAEQKIDAELAYAEGVARGLEAEALAPLKAAMESTAQVFFKANEMVEAVSNFNRHITDISSCRTRSMIIE